VDFVASSGHTVAHLPPRQNEGSGTLQIGETAIIAERCKLPVVSNFRPRDMAAGGQGAPLVPYADWILFNRKDRNAALLNIGGIANITVVPPRIEDVMAFDTGPGNMIIDGAMRLLTSGNMQMDINGELAAQGVVIDEFLEYLLEHPYFRELPPKSTGREDFGAGAISRQKILWPR
jgi:anhydro-N-acetylmuramic acid kinase